MPDSGNWLGIDYGERTLGLAIAHPLTGSARPLPPLANTGRESLGPLLRSVFDQWRPAAVVIGLPLKADGTDTPMSRRIRKLAQWFGELAPGARIDLHDERLTSESAARRFAERRRTGRARRRDAASLDSMAAVLILESWMSQQGHG
jgi:putative Holliday junction resolvase